MAVVIPIVTNIGPKIPTIALRGEGKRVMPTNDTRGGSPIRTPQTEPTSTPRWTNSDRSYFQSRKEKVADLALEENEDGMVSCVSPRSRLDRCERLLIDFQSVS